MARIVIKLLSVTTMHILASQWYWSYTWSWFSKHPHQ